MRVSNSGWSWNSTRNTGNQGINVKLIGEDFEKLSYNQETKTIVAGTSVMIFDIHILAEKFNRELLVKGGCITSYKSQTIGGIVTNSVHDSLPFCCYDGIHSITVLRYKNNNFIKEKYLKGTDGFKATIGANGLSGIILEVELITNSMASYWSNYTTKINYSLNEAYDTFINLFEKTLSQELYATQVTWVRNTCSIEESYKDMESEPTKMNINWGTPEEGKFEKMILDFPFIRTYPKLASINNYKSYFLRSNDTTKYTFAQQSAGPSGCHVKYMHHIESGVFFPLSEKEIGIELIGEFLKNKKLVNNLIFLFRIVPCSKAFIAPTSSNDVERDISFISFDLAHDNVSFNKDINDIFNSFAQKYPYIFRFHTGKLMNINSELFKNSHLPDNFSKAEKIFLQNDPNKIFRSIHPIHRF